MKKEAVNLNNAQKGNRLYQAAVPSLMAVQEVLGLFTGHQSHASLNSSAEGKTTDMQAALKEKPLTYV